MSAWPQIPFTPLRRRVGETFRTGMPYRSQIRRTYGAARRSVASVSLFEIPHSSNWTLRWLPL
jgi:hypothetical protein